MPGQTRDAVLLKKIALHIKQLRQERNITQQYVEDETNINIKRIETGKVNSSISTIKKICDYFEISLVDFFDGVEAM